MSRLKRDEIVALDKRYLWHPYTAMEDYRRDVDPLVIERAAGSRLFDVDGTSYIDANASWWVSTLGHNHPRIVEALARQAQEMCHVALAGIAHEGSARLAQKMVEVTPKSLNHVFFSDNGSTAVEVAMKLALQYWAQNGRPERRRFVALEEAFHGETMGVTSLCGVGVFKELFEETTLESFHVKPPVEAGTIDACVAELEALLVREADVIAALVLEPMVQGAGGMRIYPAEYLRAARELCDRHDIFLILDEVFTGYGRTGPMWAVEHTEKDSDVVQPDILCSAKGFSGGTLPMSATLASSRIFDGFLGGRERAFYYGHSFCGNPLGCAVALEALSVFEEEKILEQAAPKAEKIAAAFEGFSDLPGVAATRSLGMIGALNLAGDSGYLARAGWEVYEEARKRGAYLRPMGDLVYITPALTIPDADLDALLGIIEESIRAIA
ncbi:MAG: adenosylmethionine--8-amino-7-oxononanoate transaminase [Deltaproteobacteria bacterium]|nr:adenosylmethionine--8-amino-7-oxononanoate transaminase [Deltaproteobacteria bacterium]